MNAKRQGTPTRLATLLSSSALKQWGIAFDPAHWAELSRAWKEAVGEPLAAHACPLRYREGRLALAVESSVWASRIRHDHAALVARLRTRAPFKDLSGLQVRVLPREFPPDAKRRAGARRPSAQALAQIDEIAGAVKSESLRAALRRLGRG